MLAKLKNNTHLKQLSTAVQSAVPYLWQLVAAVGGLLCAVAPIYGGLRPIALALCAGMPPTWAFSTAAGAAIGYALSMDITLSVPYLSAICIIAVMRTLLSRKGGQFALYAPAVVAAIALVMLKTVFSAFNGESVVTALTALGEGAMLTGMAFLFSETLSSLALNTQKSGNGSFLFGYMVVLVVLSPYLISSLSVARIFAGVVLLVSACRGKERIAAVFGVAGAAALCATGTYNLFAATGLAVGALAAGVFAQQERVYTALVFFAAGFTGVLSAPSPTAGLLYGVELCISCVIFLLLPSRFLKNEIMKNEREAHRALAAKLSSRLDALSASLSNVGETVSSVCERLPKKGESYADVCDAVAENVCGKCKRRMFCWVDCYADTMAALHELSPELSRTGHVQTASLNDALLRRCLVPERLALGITLEYSSWQARRTARARGEIMREALREQFSSIAAAIEGFSRQLWLEQAPDKKRSKKVEQLMCTLGTQPFDVRVAQDADGRTLVEMRLARVALSSEDLRALTDEISDICRCVFSPAQCIQLGGVTTINLYEKAIYVPQFAASAIAAKETSGDAYRNFCDSRGMAYAVLCDGMGTGREAAIDGNMAATLSARLIGAGFAAKEAARLVNVALSLKSEDEAGATLDVLAVNLYTARASLYKAGAAPSYLIRNGHANEIAADTLPIGVLNTVTGKECSFAINRGDTIVLVSDGALADGDKWLCQQLELCAAEPVTTLCKSTADAARRRCSARPDDITVMAFRLA